MDVATLTQFFKYCTIINGLIFLLWTLLIMFVPNFIYNIQSSLYPIPREKYNIIMYVFLGVFKMMYIFFNVLPFIVLYSFCSKPF
jgi:hypothetical protein